MPPLELIRGSARPAAAGALDWRRPAAELSALVRALDYGQYANPLCLPKALIGGSPLVVPHLQVLEQLVQVPPPARYSRLPTTARRWRRDARTSASRVSHAGRRDAFGP